MYKSNIENLMQTSQSGMRTLMRKKIDFLNYHTKLYDEGHPEISDEEWDRAYFELDNLERSTGIRLPDSPTQAISYNVVNNLKKVEHNHYMLSLDKTKEISTIKNFKQGQELIYMLKLDGLTCSLQYEKGKLVRAETRGNGIIGEDITHNALVLPSIPNFLPTKETLTIDGEIVCTIQDFRDFEDEYKNPRNFASGSIRLLDAKECAKRKLTFVAWDVINGFNDLDTLSKKLDKLYIDFGFYCVPYMTDTANPAYSTPEEIIDFLKTNNENYAQALPIDGIVIKYNNIQYYQEQGRTDHHFKGGIAYKFYDDIFETTLLDIEFSMGRTGVLSPVAIFDPVEIDGTIVERASVHNLSILKELNLYQVGQKIGVFKANSIIPQVRWAEEVPREEDLLIEIPTKCPICGGRLEVRKDGIAEILYCTNPDCSGKLLNRLEHFLGKKGLDIKGLSKITLNKLMDWGWLNSFEDIFKLKEHRNEWIRKDGFGPKSVDKILDAIEAGRDTEFFQVISCAGIPLIGPTASREIAHHFSSWQEFRDAVTNHYNFAKLKDFGANTCVAIWLFDYSDIDRVIPYLNISYEERALAEKQILKGYRFCITGKVHVFNSRSEIEARIQELGGTVVPSVTRKTHYLINNDITSTTKKNVTAKELHVPIITEEQFIDLIRQLNNK